MEASTYRKRTGAAEVGPLSCILALLIGACTPAGPRPGAAPTPGGEPELLVLVTSGMRGRILPFDDDGRPTAASLAALAPILDSLRSAHRGPVLLLDAGGSLSGSRVAGAYAAAGGEHAMLAAMRILGYDAIALSRGEPVPALAGNSPAILAPGGPRSELLIERQLADGRMAHVYVRAADRPDDSRALVEILPSDDSVFAMPAAGKGDTLLITLYTASLEGGVAPLVDFDVLFAAGPSADGVVRSSRIRIPRVVDATDGTATAASPSRWDRALLDSVRLAHERALLRAGIAPPGAAETRVRILATADLEGRLLPGGGAGAVHGGAAALAGALELERDLFQGPSLLLDAGDAFGDGDPGDGALDAGAAAVATAEFMALAAYDAAAVGAAEAALGTAVATSFPRLSANLRVAGVDTAPSWAQPAALLDAGRGVRVGVVGLTSAAVDGTGVEVTAGAAALDRWVPELRSQGADFVVALAHGGAGCVPGEAACLDEVAGWIRASTARPDVVIAGNAHRAADTDVDGVPVVGPGAHARSYAVIDLERRDGRTTARVRGIPGVEEAKAAPDRRVSELLAYHLRRASPVGAAAILGEPIGRGPGEHPLGRLVSDAYRWATGAHIALEAGEALAADLAPGALTTDAVAAVLPREDRLIVLQLTGSQLRRLLESLIGRQPAVQLSGLLAHYDPSLPAGSRLLTVRLEDGRFIGDHGLITVAVPERLVAGTTMPILREALHRHSSGTFAREAVLDYTRGLPQPVTAPRDPRMHATEG